MGVIIPKGGSLKELGLGLPKRRAITLLPRRIESNTQLEDYWDFGCILKFEEITPYQFEEMRILTLRGETMRNPKIRQQLIKSRDINGSN